MAVYAEIQELFAQCEMSAEFNAALEYLLKFDPAYFKDKEPGFSLKVPIRGDSVYAVHQVYKTKPLSSARYEAHRKYIDIQVVWKGREVIYVASLSGLSRQTSYDRKKDIEFFDFFKGAGLNMISGMAAVLYPSDAHAPGISMGGGNIIFKTVIKVIAKT